MVHSARWIAKSSEYYHLSDFYFQYYMRLSRGGELLLHSTELTWQYPVIWLS